MPGMDLMECAGNATFDAALKAYPQARNILVFCGGGNNGGDGYVIARLARERGLNALVCALREPGRLAGDAATAAGKWLQAGGEVSPWPVAGIDHYDLIFDALLGTGLDREPAGDYASAIALINESGKPVIAVDIPSGLNADTGVAMGRAVRAALTVTFVGRKRGLYTADGPDFTGLTVFHDLHIPSSVKDSEPGYGELLRRSLVGSLLPVRRRNSHKGSFGWMLGVGGNLGMSGAVRLAGEAALRSGAGKVTLATRPEHAGLINLGCPELMVKGADSAEDIKSLLGRVDAVVTGTGSGQGDWSEQMLRAGLRSAAPVVVDADGLNILARLFAELKDDDWPAQRWILTPHPAEAGRLLGCTAGEVQADRVTAALELAKRFQAVVALKGCGTVVADFNQRYAICRFGNPGMASAGSGDVLAGVIGAMVAQKLDPWEAAVAGVLAHALAGDLAARELGERGMLASDISSRLPRVLNPS